MQVTKWNGKPISKPGWYSGIPIERYHSAGICDSKAVSSSDLRTCWSKSPAHMFAKWAENENREERSTTGFMLLGAVAHHILLGEDKFRLKYVAFPPTYRDKKTAIEKPWHNGSDFAKDWTAKQEAAGRVPVPIKDLNKILAMAQSLTLEPMVQQGMLRGWVECSGFVKDRETGLWIKVRPDVVPTAGPDFVDLKTASEVTTPALMSSVRSYGYHQQGALIGQVCEELNQPFETFTLLFIETESPYCARTAPVKDDTLGLGARQNRWALRRVARCIEDGRWPGPDDGNATPISLAKDEIERINTRLKLEGMA